MDMHDQQIYNPVSVKTQKNRFKVQNVFILINLLEYHKLCKFLKN